LKILIRNTNNGQYCDENDGWTASIAEARDFKRGLLAMDHIDFYGLKDVLLLYSFDEPKYDFTLPIYCTAQTGRKADDDPKSTQPPAFAP
jgi:hypothetical protein